MENSDMITEKEQAQSAGFKQDKSPNLWVALVRFLREKHFFEAWVNIAWSMAIVAMSVFVDYNLLNIHISDRVCFFNVVILTIIGFIIWRNIRNNEDGTVAIWSYQIFYYFIPAIVNIIRLIFMDALYSFGGFMPGMESLGLFVVSIGYIVIIAVGCIIFNIVRIRRRKKTESGNEKNNGSRVSRIVVDILNVALFLIIVLLIVGLLISWGAETVKRVKYKTELSINDKYREEVLTSLTESALYERAVWRGVNGDSTSNGNNESSYNKLFEEAEGELCWEAYTYSLFVEALANDPEIQPQIGESVGVSSITPDVYEQGRQNYIEFTKRYTPERGVEMSDQKILYDAATQTVSVSSQLYCVDEENNCTIHACMVVVFDKDWNVKEIRCQDNSLIQYTPY